MEVGLLLVLPLLGIFAAPLRAQVGVRDDVASQFREQRNAFDPAAQRSRQQSWEEQEELERRTRELEERSKRGVVEEEGEGPRSLPPEATKPMIDLVRVDVDPSEILTVQEIEAVVAPYLGKKVSLADLYAIVAGIDQLYRAKGYITAKANLPPQKVAGGIVRIQLIEARVGQVHYEGNRTTRQSFLERRLRFVPGELVDVRVAEKALRRFNRINDIVANLVLSPGKEPGTTDLRLKIDEPPPLEIDLALDNYGPRSSGTSRRGLNLSMPSLLGLRDPITVGGYNSEGIDAVYFSYEIPITDQDTRLSVMADYSHPKAFLVDDGQFPVDADGYSTGMTFSHPVWVGDTTMVRTFLSGYRRFSKFEFLTGTRSGSSNPDDPNQPLRSPPITTDIWTSEGGVLAEIQDRRGVWVASVMVEGVFDRDGTDEEFFKTTGSLTRHQNLLPGVWATARVNGQVVDRDDIVAAESFQAGGAFTVRGYPEAFTLGDQGYLASVQVNAMLPPDLQPVKALDEVRGFLFTDHAGLFGDGYDDDLLSVGGGFYVSLSRSAFVELAVGVPLTDRREPGVGDLEAHFAVHFMPPVSRWLGWSS